ncbi:TRAP transporter small permease [Castellaniella sp.]|uniref:TRAP transporter small permease n=1 Tax=Castellaniella sp. TaxID=1955812 RepID=UPI0035639677
MAVINAFRKVVDALLALALAVIVTAMLYQVGARYLYHAALPWPEELSQLLLVILSFFGMYRAIDEDLHIRLNLIPAHLSGVAVRALKTVAILASTAFLAYISFGGYELALRSWNQPSMAMRLPMGWFYLAIPVACGLSVLALIGRLAELYTKDPRQE